MYHGFFHYESRLFLVLISPEIHPFCRCLLRSGVSWVPADLADRRGSMTCSQGSFLFYRYPEWRQRDGPCERRISDFETRHPERWIARRHMRVKDPRKRTAYLIRASALCTPTSLYWDPSFAHAHSQATQDIGFEKKATAPSHTVVPLIMLSTTQSFISYTITLTSLPRIEIRGN